MSALGLLLIRAILISAGIGERWGNDKQWWRETVLKKVALERSSLVFWTC